MNEKRTVFDLGGLWDFCLGGESFDKKCLAVPLEKSEKMFVPASYNDQKADKKYREHYGYAYYQRRFSVPNELKSKRLVLRFGAVAHNAEVWLNGKRIVSHTGGFLPFEAELDANSLKKQNLLSVAVDNRIDLSTLPVGNEIKKAMFGDAPPDFESVRKTKIKNKNYPNFDFFNYCGINRPVFLCVMPTEYISDISIISEIKDGFAVVKADVSLSKKGNAKISVFDKEGREIVRGIEAGSEFIIENPHLWEPNNAYLYTAKVTFGDDCYYQKFGIRSIEIKGDKFLINGKPFYFKGFGKHEDSETHGRGYDGALNVKDISLMKWINANSFRTSHYPYAEEMLSLCDEEGIVVIGETPAVGLGFSYGNEAEQAKLNAREKHHKEVLAQMIERDKNHPCIVAWSLANEPDSTGNPERAREYFKTLYDLAHRLDPQSRPVTVVACNNDYVKDKVTELSDIICLNRYYGWYIFAGDLDAAKQAMTAEMEYFSKFCKPLMITEYGADAAAGIHSVTANTFSEEYQLEFYEAINSVLDKYGFVVGEQVWNFADFSTVQGVMRVDGNKKGLFTRDRRPKLAAHYFRKRWGEIPDFGYKCNNKGE